MEVVTQPTSRVIFPETLPKTSNIFLDEVVTRENLPTWETLWDDCIQNQIKKNHLGAAKPVQEDDNVAFL